MNMIKYSFFLLFFLSLHTAANDTKRTLNVVDYHNVYERATGRTYGCSPTPVSSEMASSYKISYLPDNLNYANVIPSYNGSPIYFAMANKKTSIFEYPQRYTSYFKFRDRKNDDTFEFICIMKNDFILTCVNESSSILAIDSKQIKYNSLQEGSVIINVASNYKINSFSFNFDTENIDYTVRERKKEDRPDTYTVLRIPYGQKKNFILHEE